jgi:hypothetical protein
MSPKNAFYAQSGGVTSVINASACGVIETSRKHQDKIGKVFAGRNGIIGALSEELIDTSRESDTNIAALKNTQAKLVPSFIRNIVKGAGIVPTASGTLGCLRDFTEAKLQ